MNEKQIKQIKQIIYNANKPRMNQIVAKIDKCFNDENKAGMLKYINYIEQFVSFVDGVN